MVETPRIGEVWDERYEILESVGGGGIASVFKAQQLELDRLVALKVLHPFLAEDEEFKARFLIEAKSLSKLKHPNIVTVYHAAISEYGLPYLAMELVDGKSLRSICGEPTLPARALKITEELAGALSYVHGMGIVHRDLKPENILLLEQQADMVKLIDFGLAKISSHTIQKLTSTGTLIGSPVYMSPEQCAGKAVDARSDVYSLTVCFFELLTGKPPFTADTPIGVMYKHMHDPIPILVSSNNDQQCQLLNHLIARGMAKEKEDRYISMDEFKNAVRKVCLETSPTTFYGSIAPTSPPQSHESRLAIRAKNFKISEHPHIFFAICSVTLLVIVSTAMFFIIYGSPPVATNPADRTDGSAASPNRVQTNNQSTNPIQASPSESELVTHLQTMRKLCHSKDPLEINNLKLTQTLDDLAKIYESRGDFVDAAPLLEEFLKIRETASGPLKENSYYIGYRLHVAYKALGKETEAKKLGKYLNVLSRECFGTDATLDGEN